MATKKAKSQDEIVQELFDKVQLRKAELQNAEKSCWQTSGTFGFTADSSNGRISIQSMTDTRKLTEIMTFLIERSRTFAEASEILGLDHKFTWLGYSVAEWTSDLKTRVTQIQKDKKKKELAELEVRLNNLISPELKAKLELAELSKLLDNN